MYNFLADRLPSQQVKIPPTSILQLSHMISYTERKGSDPWYLAFNMPFQVEQRNATRDRFLGMQAFRFETGKDLKGCKLKWRPETGVRDTGYDGMILDLSSAASSIKSSWLRSFKTRNAIDSNETCFITPYWQPFSLGFWPQDPTHNL